MLALESRRAAAVAAAALSLWSLAALAAPEPGVDCGCAKVGPYLLPAPAVPRAHANAVTNLSPGGKYQVTAVPTPTFPQPSEVTVTRVADGAVLLAGQPGADWGFSPDDDRFLLQVAAFGGAPAMTYLYDLTEVPGKLLASFQPSTLGSAISFSPHGVWVMDLELVASPTHAELRVLDAATGVQVLSDAFNFTPATGKPGDQLGAARFGFGPDAADRTLTWAYLTGATSTQWSAANLAAGARVVGQPLGGAFTWGFSPCGDVLGVVNEDLGGSLKYAEVHRTLSTGVLGSAGPFPATDSTALSVTAASHQLLHNVTNETLAANGAGAACPAPPANIRPVAAFPVPSTRLALLPVQFTDQSHDADGRVVAWSWGFGDGQFSTLRNPSHVYLAGGSYSVTLTVTDDRGGTDAVSHAVVVAANQPPDAGFTFVPAAPARRDLVTFTDVSTDDDGVAQRHWNIDGVDFSTPTVTVRACPPSLVVFLSVQDHAGQGASVSAEIPVDGGGPDILVPAGADLAAAIAGACPGDRLVLAPGHYTGGVTLPPKVSLAGAGMGVTFLDGWGSGPSHWVLQANVDLSISDLSLTDGGLGGFTGSQDTAGGGLHLLPGRDPGAGAIRVSRVEVAHNVGSGGIWLEDNYGNPVELTDLKVHHNRRDLPGQGGGSGIDLFCCSAVTVQGSEFTANTSPSGAGPVHLWEAEQVVFRGNHVHGNEGVGLVTQTIGGGSRPPGEVSLNRITGNGAGARIEGQFVVAGNLVAGNAGAGLSSRAPLTIVNTTIADNLGEGLVAPTATLWNTIVAGNLTDEGGDPDAGGSNLLGGDAGFVGGGDYHLAPGSPAIDHGDTAAVPASLLTDGDGDPRVLGPDGGPAVVDIGWDESTFGTVPPPPDAGPADAGPGADAGPPAVDAGPPVDAGADAGPGGGGTPPAGCGCGATSPGTASAAALAALWVLARRRRGPGR